MHTHVRHNHNQSSSRNNDTATMNTDNNTNSTSDEENSGTATGTGGGASFQPTANITKKKASRNSSNYRPAASGRRSNNLRPHPSKYLPPFLQNGGSSRGSGGKNGLHSTSPASNSNSNSSSIQSLASYNKNHRHHHHHTATGSTTKRAPPPIKTAIRFEEEEEDSYVQHPTATTAASTATSTTSTTMMSSPPPSSSGRRSSNASNGSGSGRYHHHLQRTPHTMHSNDRHADIPDANVFGAITFSSTPEEDEDEVNNNGKVKGGSRKARFAGGSNSSMSGGGGSHRGRGTGNSTAANGKKQQYRKTPHWKKKVEGATSTDASNNMGNNPNDGGMQSYHQYYHYQGDYDYETGLISTDQNSVSGNGGGWYSPAPASQYNYEYGEEYRHHPPQAPPTDDGEGTGTTKDKMMTTMMPNAALDYIHSARAEVASLTSPNVRALSAMAKPWDTCSSSFKSPTSSAVASASKSATPLSTGGTSYGSSINDFQILSPKSDLTSNATNTPSTGGTRSSGSGAANRSPFVSPTTEQLASWASGASPTSSSVASALEKSLLSPGSALSASVTAAPCGSTRASSDGRVVRTPGGSIGIGSSGGIVPSGGGFNVLSSPGNTGTTIVESAGGSIGIGDVSQYLLSSSGSAAANSFPADNASPSAVDKTDAAICLGGGGSARGVLSPTTTIASEDAFTPSLRAEESGHGIGTDATEGPGDDEGIKTKKVDASTSTHDNGTPSGIPKMVEARTQTEDITAGQDPTKESGSSISSNIVTKLSSMKMDATPKGQGQAKKIAMSATAAEFTPSFSKMSTTTGTGHTYAPTASSTPAPILSAKTQLAYIPTEIDGVIHYVPTHVVLPASSPYSYTQHYLLQTAAGSVGASIGAESGPAAGARPRKPCRISSPATNDARAKSTMKTMNALAQEFEPSPKKDGAE